MNKRRFAGPIGLVTLVLLALGMVSAWAAAKSARPSEPLPPERPHVLLITVDTLRADRMGSYGYDRPTSPNLDRLLNGGVRFTQARVVEPLTAPALSSMLTSRYPHEHGTTRNGLRMFRGLTSLPKSLEAEGYRTAAFVGNWTLKDKLSGLGEHFDRYEPVLTASRWLFLRREADAADITSRAVEWLRHQQNDRPLEPFLLWVHYVEPHAPYQEQEEFVEPLGLAGTGKLSPAERYDTEVAFVDHSIGQLLAEFERWQLQEDTLVVFASDHGESLGEHGYWGHGRHLYEPSLWIPMGMAWQGQLNPIEIGAPSLNIDLAPTVLGLLDIDTPDEFSGFDWSGVLAGNPLPRGRVTHYQAHKGAVISNHESMLARRLGLLAVAVIAGNRKEIMRIETGQPQVYDLGRDPGELAAVSVDDLPAMPILDGWVELVNRGLEGSDAELPAPLDEESIEQLRALGYVN